MEAAYITLCAMLVLCCLITSSLAAAGSQPVYVLGHSPALSVGKSLTGGRGVFAMKSIAQNEIIEVCPAVVVPAEESPGFSDYLFDGPIENTHAMALGFGSLYNHQDQNNAEMSYDNDGNLVVKALRRIKPGEEVFISYGNEWWQTRNSHRNILM